MSFTNTYSETPTAALAPAVTLLGKVCAGTSKAFSTTLIVYINPATGCMWVTRLELALKTGHAGLWVPTTEVLYAPPQITGSYLSISTSDCLQNSIIDEDILLLHIEGRGGGGGG